MIRIGIVGIGFMGMKRRRILRSVRKPVFSVKSRLQLAILCVRDSLLTQGMAQRIPRNSWECQLQRPDTIEKVGNPKPSPRYGKTNHTSMKEMNRQPQSASVCRTNGTYF